MKERSQSRSAMVADSCSAGSIGVGEEEGNRGTEWGGGR